MGLLKAPLAPLALSLLALGVVATLVFHLFIGLSLTLLGACLLFVRVNDPRDDSSPPR